MSQRLHIGHTDSNIYNCVITELAGHEDKLLDEWLHYSYGYYCGPWRIAIGNIELFKQVEPTIAGIFEILKREYPEEIWTFKREGKDALEHPSMEQLDEWLK
jgi:hypothetical protein